MSANQNTNPAIELGDIYSELINEIEALAGEEYQGTTRIFPNAKSLTPRERRQLIRAIAAMIEATCYQVRLIILEDSPQDIEAAMRFGLMERQIDISNNGDVEVKNLKVSAIDGFKFTFKAFDKLFNTNLCPDFGSVGFTKFRSLFSTRNLLMHPKKMADISVTDDQILDALDAFVWYEHLLPPLLEASNKAIEEDLERLKKELGAIKMAPADK